MTPFPHLFDPAKKTGVPNTPVFANVETLGSTHTTEYIPMHELHTQASFGLQQRILAGYDPSKQNFMMSVLLEYPSQPIPSTVLCNAYLADAKAGVVDSGKLVLQLPAVRRNAHNQVEKVDVSVASRELFSMKGKRLLHPKEVEAVYKLVGHDTRMGPFTQEKYHEFLNLYAGERGNLFLLIAHMQGLGIEEKTILSLSRILHGDLRIEVLKGISALNRIVRQDPSSWQEATRKLWSRRLSTKDEEVKSIIDGRVACNLPIEVSRKKEKPQQRSKQDIKQRPVSQGGEKKSDTHQQRRVEGVERSKDSGSHIGYVSERVWTNSKFGFAQHVGRFKYDHQEDSYQAIQDEKGRVIFSVNDGVGGQKSGEYAAKVVAYELYQLERAFPSLPSSLVHGEIQDALERAHITINKKGAGADSTTAVAFIDEYNRLYTFHAGDSRILVIRDGRIVFSTVDHTLVQNLYSHGDITAEEARGHKERNIITNSVGGVNSHIERNGPFQLMKGDLVLGVTDGMTRDDVVEGNTIIAGYVRNFGNSSAQQVAQGLVNNALSSLSPDTSVDNVTVVSYKVL